MNENATKGLERSCGPAKSDWIRTAPSGSTGFERFEAFFAGHAFGPHRHDTYAIGMTLDGVQSFSYRGAAQHSTSGQVFVLHPDELHDGHAGTDTGFRYRILYVDPGLIHDALRDTRCPLPFVRDVVSTNRRLAAAIGPALGDLDRTPEELQVDQIVADLADALAAADPSIGRRTLSVRHWRAVEKARDALDADIGSAVSSTDLEAITGLSRYDLARHFRACLGTSPYRYLVMRRLDRVRDCVLRGASLADAAATCGFADQSHMTRHFTKAYGLSPGRWAAIRARSAA